MPRFTSFLTALRSYDWLLIATVFALSSIGLAAIYSVDLSRSGGGELTYVPKQLAAFVIGLAVLFLGGAAQVGLYEASARVWYALAAALLVMVLFWGETINHTTGWFRFGGLSFQPAEFAKASLIVLLSYLVSRVGRRFDRAQYVVLTLLATALPVGLVFLQPDLGSALVLVGIWFSFLAITIPKKRYVLGILAVGLAVAAIGVVFFAKEYQRERILTFLSPERDPLDAGYNVSQSMIAIGAGRIFGRGLGFGSQSQLRFLPEAQTDFIFSVVGEEMGFVGAAMVLTLYAVLLWRLVSAARRAENDFTAYFMAGTALFFFIQMFMNIGSAIGLLPVIGVTLPFMSYGGSSLIVNFLLIGVAQSAIRSVRVHA